MKAKEFIIVEKKRKNRRPRWAAYGPGPYGMYGVDTGYSGVSEATYPGNIGMMELTKFFQIANNQQKDLFKKLLETGKKGLAWKLVQDTVGVKLQGKEFEDHHPNERPLGPEFKPTMPKGTVKVDVSDVYDWYKLGQHISNLKGLGKHDFGKGPPSAILSFGDEDLEHEYIKALAQIGLDITDIDPAYHNDKKKVKTDPTYNVENFADGKVKGKSRPGRVKKSGASCKGSVTDLRARAKKYGGERGKMYHWCANMKGGKKK